MSLAMYLSKDLVNGIYLCNYQLKWFNCIRQVNSEYNKLFTMRSGDVLTRSTTGRSINWRRLHNQRGPTVIIYNFVSNAYVDIKELSHYHFSINSDDLEQRFDLRDL